MLLSAPGVNLYGAELAAKRLGLLHEVDIVIVVDAAKCLQQFGEERQPMLRYLM